MNPQYDVSTMLTIGRVFKKYIGEMFRYGWMMVVARVAKVAVAAGVGHGALQ